VDEDRFNMSVRKFLKEVGVTSQREIEKAVWDAVNAGRFKDGAMLDAKMTLEISGVDLTHVVDGQIDVG
jgi:hypothetical protein